MASPQWRFADFRLDPDNACLWRGTQSIALAPKTFEVLHYLVTHPDRLVTKDTLLDAVWPETAVSDAVMRIAIGEVRRALGDTAQAPQFIATVHRRGYRFVAPVVEHTETVPGPTAAPPLETPDTPHQQAVVPLIPPLPPPEAERRHLTVLFCDLVGSTALTGRLDPEDYREVVRAYHHLCAEVLQRFDGYLAQYLGDGVLGYFGYPVAHEDDAQRAVRAGLGLLDACASLSTHPALPPGDQVAVRLGVHTGLVVMGDVGVGAHHEPLALGETPNIAARLQHLATPNTLVISAATHQLVAGYFRCKALGTPTLPGLAQPLEVYRVLGTSGVQSRLEVAATYGLTPLVGRVQEVGLLMACWARVTEGMGQVVILGGEAGIGKSRLVQVLKEHVASEGHLWLECQGSPYYQHTALYPLTELLALRLLHVEHEATTAQTAGARAYSFVWLAEALGKASEADAGLHILAEGLARVEQHEERVFEAELHRLKGELLLAQSRNQHAAAHACFQQALVVARHQQAKSLELRAAMSLSRLWHQQGKRAEARELLAPSYSWFTEGFDTADLQDARALLEELA